MNILIAGNGKMGGWLSTILCRHHHVGIIDKQPVEVKPATNITVINKKQEIAEFNPDLLVNAVTLDATRRVFEELMPWLPGHTMLADMASVKNGISSFYQQCGRKFVSTHPMFGPTFADLQNLKSEHAILIKESDQEGKKFFEQLFSDLGLTLHHLTFREHDERMSESLSVPFILSMLFASQLRENDHPGTTYDKHLQIARGLFTEDHTLLTEVLMNPATLEKISGLKKDLDALQDAIEKKDASGLMRFLGEASQRVSSGQTKTTKTTSRSH
jgi:prephenate dehydrogenase